MRISYAYLVAAGLTAISAAVALWAWISLPPGAGVPIHVYTLGGFRQTGSSRALVWLLPFVSTIVTLAFAAGAQRRGVERAAKPYESTLIAVTGVLLVTEYALAGRAFDPTFDVMRPVALATGALLLVVGNFLGKARQNAVFGIRTPWTLADAGVWDRTHRFTGRAMFAGGLVLIAASFILKEGVPLGLAIGACAAVPALAGVAYSASVHRDAQRG